MNENDKKKWIINVVYIFLLLFVFIIFFKFTLLYLVPFIVGYILAFLVQKPAMFLERKFKIKKQICATVLSAFSYFFIAIILSLLIWCVVINGDKIIDYVTKFSDSCENFLIITNRYLINLSSRLGGGFQTAFERAVDEYINNITTKIIAIVSNYITGLVKNLPTIFLTAIITIVSSCYFARDFDKFTNFIKGVISEKIYKNFLLIKNIFTNSVIKLLIGYAKIMLITFFELLIGFSILGVNHFIIFAFMVSIIDLLPIVGTGTVLLPWAMISFVQNNYKLGFGITLIYVIVCIIRNFVEPKIIGDEIGINPLFTLIAMFLGFKILGFFGVIIFPVTFIVVFTFYRNKFA